MSPWVNFCIVIFAQFVIFLLVAYKRQQIKKVTFRLVAQSVAFGIIAGTIFDLVVGKYIGIFDYALDFTPLFLVINGAISYGLWILTVHMLQAERLLPFCVWTIVIGLLYEVVNYFFQVWHWTFGSSFLYQETIVITVAYSGLGLLTAIWLSIVTKERFRFLR